MVFPTKSSTLLSAGFTTPSKLTLRDSNLQLDSKVSITLLASSASRRTLGLNVDENGNSLVTASTTNMAFDATNMTFDATVTMKKNHVVSNS
jgi:hypothetical protein